MAKIVLGNLVPTAASITGGRFYVRDTKYGPVAQAAPRQPKQRNNSAVQWWREQFAIAARMASTPEPLSMLTAIEMAKGTEQVPRDILMMCAYGTYYEIFGPDGAQWLPSYKGPPATNKATKMKEPFDAELWDLWATAPQSTSAFAFKGSALIFRRDVKLTAIIVRLATVAAAQYRAVAATIDTGGTVLAIASGPIVQASISATQNIELPIEATLQAGQRVAIMAGRTDAAATYILPMFTTTPAALHTPTTRLSDARLASTSPSVGDTLNLATNTAWAIAYCQE